MTRADGSQATPDDWRTLVRRLRMLAPVCVAVAGLLLACGAVIGAAAWAQSTR